MKLVMQKLLWLEMMIRIYISGVAVITTILFILMKDMRHVNLFVLQKILGVLKVLRNCQRH